MKSRRFLTLTLATLITLVSCQKQIELEDAPATGGNNNSLEGEYTLVDIRVQATSTSTFNEGGVQTKSITITDYTTKNNQGNFTVNASQFITTNMSYSVDTTVKAYFYLDGIFLDSVEAPFAVDIPATNSTSSYTKVGTDSLTFQSGFVTGPSGTGIPMDPGSSGAKYSWSGDILLLSSNFAITKSQELSGVTVNITYTGRQTTRLKKK